MWNLTRKCRPHSNEEAAHGQNSQSLCSAAQKVPEPRRQGNIIAAAVEHFISVYLIDLVKWRILQCINGNSMMQVWLNQKHLCLQFRWDFCCCRCWWQCVLRVLKVTVLHIFTGQTTHSRSSDVNIALWLLLTFGNHFHVFIVIWISLSMADFAIFQMSEPDLNSSFISSSFSVDLSGKMFVFPKETNTAHVRLTPSREDYSKITICHRYTWWKRQEAFPFRVCELWKWWPGYFPQVIHGPEERPHPFLHGHPLQCQRCADVLGRSQQGSRAPHQG